MPVYDKRLFDVTRNTAYELIDEPNVTRSYRDYVTAVLHTVYTWNRQVGDRYARSDVTRMANHVCDWTWDRLKPTKPYIDVPKYDNAAIINAMIIGNA